MENTITLSIGRMGYHGMWELRNELNQFVRENYAALVEGGKRLGLYREPDQWTDYSRVYVGETRLHRLDDLKYAAGHKYDSHTAPTEEQLLQTVADLRILIEAYEKDIPRPFLLRWE